MDYLTGHPQIQISYESLSSMSKSGHKKEMWVENRI